MTYEQLAMLLMKLIRREKEESEHFIFISMPLNYEDETINEDEGMIGKILNDARKN